MNRLLLALLAVTLTAISYAADKNIAGHYLLIYPSSTVETDLSGRCVCLANTSDALVYLPINDHGDFTDSLKVAGKRLKVSECAAR